MKVALQWTTEKYEKEIFMPWDSSFVNNNTRQAREKGNNNHGRIYPNKEMVAKTQLTEMVNPTT